MAKKVSTHSSSDLLTVLYYSRLSCIVDDRTEFDFQGLRMDWFRLQALTSVYKAPLK